MGKAPGAAACQHQAHGPARQDAGEAREVGAAALAQIIVLAHGHVGRQAEARASGLAGGLQQEQFGVLPAQAAKRLGVGEADGDGFACARDEEDAVGLAQAELRPGRLAGVGHVEHDVVFHLAAREPVAVVGGGIACDGLGLEAEAAEGADEALAQRPCVDAGLQRHEGDGAGHLRACRGAARGALQATDQQAHEVHRQARVAGEKLLEVGLGNAQEFAVAQCHEARGVRAARDDGHLAHGLARGDACEQAVLAVVVGGEDAEASRHHDEDGVVVLALANQGLAAGQEEPCRAGEERCRCLVAEACGDRECLEALAQLGGDVAGFGCG